MRLEPSALRKTIDDAVRIGDHDHVAEIPKIKLVERRDFDKDGDNGYHCEWYVFRELGIPWREPYDPNHLLEGMREVKKPKKGDLVLYLEDNHPKHWGIHVGSGRVRSKWGAGHIFEHDIAAVMSVYGNLVIFYRKV